MHEALRILEQDIGLNKAMDSA